MAVAAGPASRWTWAAVLLGVLLLAACAPAPDADRRSIAPTEAEVLTDTDPSSPQSLQPPADNDPRWRTVALPDVQMQRHAWYRVAVQMPLPVAASVAPDGAWMVYLPYLYGGGQVWFNGALIAAVPENSPGLRVRWERPHLVGLPPALQRAGTNWLLLRTVALPASPSTRLPPLVVGPQVEVQPLYDARFFVMRTIPVMTVFVAGIAGLFVLAIWWRRPHEWLYGLSGLVALAWALRTTTFVFDTLPTGWWAAWRFLYHVSNGGFIILMAMFALVLAGWARPWLLRAMAAFWAVGPVIYLAGGGSPAVEEWVNRWWLAGMIPIGLMALVVVLLVAWRQPTPARRLVALAFVLAFLSGIHDYLLAWQVPWFMALWPQWTAQRIFVLHYGANLLLLTLAYEASRRYLRGQRALEESHHTLGLRVAEREREIAASYARIATLQREQAATEERQRILQDLHDGLGAQLFTSLLRAERGVLDAAQMRDSLRGAIDAMRVAIETLGAEDGDFRTAFGDFHYRWDTRLRDAGLACTWEVALPDAPLPLSRHATLQVLHVAQESLTNVLRHAQAASVTVELALSAGVLQLQVRDDGRGLQPPAGPGGRGLANMRARAERLGGVVVVGPWVDPVTGRVGGTRVLLSVPLHDGNGATVEPYAAASRTIEGQGVKQVTLPGVRSPEGGIGARETHS